MKWIDAQTLGVQGKGFDTIGYRRLTEEEMKYCQRSSLFL